MVFRRKHPYSKLRPDKLKTDFGRVVGLAILLLIVRLYSDVLNSMTIWLLEMVTTISLISPWFIVKNLYKIFVNLRYGFRGLTNGSKLVSIILLILLFWQTCPIQDGFGSSDSIFNEDYSAIPAQSSTTHY